MYHRLSFPQLTEVLDRAPADQWWVLDTETNGLDVIGHAAPHYAWWIGLAPLGSPNTFVISRDEFEEWGLEERFRRLRLIGHNLRFDLHALDLVPEVEWRDTMVAAYFSHTSGRHSMDHIAAVNGWHSIPTPPLLKQGKIAQVPEAELFEYLANDCTVTSLMAKRLRMDAAAFDYKVEKAVYEMERQGIELLLDKLAGVRRRLTAMEADALAHLQGTGLEGNPDSPIQVAEWLMRKGRKLPTTKTGRPSTSKIALQQLADKGDTLADAIISYRKLVKLRTAFVDALPEMAVDGVLYPQTNTTRTKTGRFSCNAPNLQQIPKRGPLRKDLRGCMTSRAGRGVTACDFSQIELRVAAALANEPVLLEAFGQGRCPHTEVAAKMLGKSLEDVTPEERFGAKAVNFGILNGMGAKRLAIELKSDPRVARRFLDDYRRNLPVLSAWMEGIWREAEEDRVAKTVAGRARIFTSKEDTRPAVSVIVQGSAAELMRHALVAVSEAGLQPILTVHDEILVPGQGSEIKGRLEECMATAANEAYPDAFGSVRFECSADSGETWGDV
jgi:DNA polymerase-1